MLMNRLDRWRTLSVLVCMSLVVGACSHGPDAAADGTGDFDLRVTQALEEARNQGASDDQLASLEQASVDGGVSFEDAKTAAVATVSCMASQGLEATYQEDTIPNGVTIPGYTIQEPEDSGLLAVIDQCEYSEFYWVNMLYQMQPSSIEANLAYIEKQEPVVRQCLEDAGYDTDPDATGMDLVLQSEDIAGSTGGALDCAFDAGILGY